MTIALIAAVAGEKLVIGKDGDLPWHYSADLKFFKEKTMGHAVLMGRVTYQSILKRLGKPLPGRKTIVMTRDKDFRDERVMAINNLKDIASVLDPSATLYVIGGASIYAQTIDIADVLYITHIDQEIEGDSFFPSINPAKWKLVEEGALVEKDVRLRFCTYKKA